MTTNTPSQAASIDTPEFQALMNKMMGRLRTADLTGYNLDVKAWGDAMREVVAHIDAQMVKDHNRGYAAGYAMMEARATAAESRLAEIQRGVKGLRRYEFRTGFKLDVPAAGILPTELGPYVMFEAVENLLTPQGQSDTSGLPG